MQKSVLSYCVSLACFLRLAVVLQRGSGQLTLLNWLTGTLSYYFLALSILFVLSWPLTSPCLIRFPLVSALHFVHRLDFAVRGCKIKQNLPKLQTFAVSVLNLEISWNYQSPLPPQSMHLLSSVQMYQSGFCMLRPQMNTISLLWWLHWEILTSVFK